MVMRVLKAYGDYWEHKDTHTGISSGDNEVVIYFTTAKNNGDKCPHCDGVWIEEAEERRNHVLSFHIHEFEALQQAVKYFEKEETNEAKKLLSSFYNGRFEEQERR